MKSKSTLRKLAPLTRAIAKLQRDTHSLERRFDSVVKLADEIEQEGRALRRENAELRGKLCLIPGFNSPSRSLEVQAAIDNTPTTCGVGEVLWPEEAL